ncbi:AsmA family protein [Zhengella sp. ZM62]|uniref:AsmA family protein n=1 Tax=Zhengella sedimenti TaxID=3390035 RepID=UPI003976E56D
MKSGSDVLNRLFVIIGGLVVAVLAAAVIAPPFIDWSSYRADFEREASRILGRQVTVGGQASARLLPFPSVRFSDVTVAGAEGEPPIMTAESFSMDAELSPFLRGEILIFDMRLTKPRLTVGIDSGGVLDWAIRPQAPDAVSDITLEQVRIVDGELVIRHAASGMDQTVSNIDASLSADSLRGPWRMAGSAEVMTRSGQFSFSTGSLTDDGRIRLRTRIEPDDADVTFEADGNALLENGAPRYSGTFTFGPRAKAEDEPEEAFTISVPMDTAWAGIRLSGSFTLDDKLLAFDTIRFESGPSDDPYTAEGTGFIDLGREPRFALKLEGRQVQLAAGDVAGAPVSFPTRLAAFRKFLDNLPQPALPGTIDMNLPAVVAGDTTIRDLSFAAQPRDDGWNLSRFSAKLPGRTTLEAAGLLRNDGAVSFDGRLLLAIAQPSGFAAWLSEDVDDAIRRLGSAGLSGEVNLSQERQSIRDLEAILGGAKFTGGFDRLSPAGEKPSTVVELDGQALDLDGFQALAALFLGEQGEVRLARDDLDLTLIAGPVSFSGARAETVDVALRIKDAVVDINRFNVTGLEGTDFSASGQLRDYPLISSATINATIASGDMSKFVELMSLRFPENRALKALDARIDGYPGLLADTRLDLSARVEDDGVRVSGQGRAGGTGLDVRLTGGRTLAAGEGAVQFSLTGVNDEGEAILAAWGLPVLPVGLAGRIETGLQINGSMESGLAVSATLSGPTALLRFSGDARIDGEKIRVTGNGELKGDDVTPWLMATGYGLPGVEFGLPVVLESPFTFMDGVLGLAAIEGSVAGSAVRGTAELRAENGRPLLTGNLTTRSFSMDWLAGYLLGSDSVALAGTGEWEDVPFVSQGQLPFDARVSLETDGIALSGARSLRNAKMRLTVDRNRVRLSDLDAAFADGTISGLVEMANASGSATMSSQLNLAGARLGTLFPDLEAEGIADISANIAGSGKTPAAFLASLSGSGTVKARNLVLSGLDAGAYPAMIRAADMLGPEIDAEAVSRLAIPILTEGRLRLGEADFAFTIAGGVVRSAPIRIASGSTDLTTEVMVDLASGERQASGTISFDPGDDKLAGSEPVVGFAWSDADGLKLDTGPLTQFLTQRALEREQARVEAMQALLLEKQRLRREAGFFAALETRRAERRAEEERRQAEEMRLRAEEEALRQQPAQPRPGGSSGENTPRSEQPEAPAGSDDILRQPLAPPEPRPRSTEGLDAIFDNDALSIEGILRSERDF